MNIALQKKIPLILCEFVANQLRNIVSFMQKKTREREKLC